MFLVSVKRGSIFKMQQLMLSLLSLLLQLHVSRSQWQQWGNKIEKTNKIDKSNQNSQSVDSDQGTYNPKSAWMFVDSRRRVLPDIDGESIQKYF